MEATNADVGSPASIAQRAAKATPLLTCERCRERKVKCDKLEPCTNCVVAGVVCVATRRMRLPRGSHAQPTAAASDGLRQRIRKLEAVIERMSSLREAPPGATASPGRPSEATDGSVTADSTSTPGPSTSFPMQGPDDFWSYLVEEMHGLREVIDSAAGSVENDEHESVSELEPADRGMAIPGLASFHGSPYPYSNSRAASSGLLLLSLSTDQLVAAKLCRVYLRQVDPIIKILHRPSVSRWLLDGHCYLDYPLGHSSVEALRGAIYYFAVCSLTESQCQAEMGASKTELVAECRRECEAAMQQSGLLTTRDITVLQAFVLYLFARKIQDKSRAVWTLVALAVRVARALRLDQNPAQNSQTETFFYQQARRRLWATICLLDMQAAQSQATQPLIGSEGEHVSFTLPGHINDADFGPDTTELVPDREGITDTTNAHVTYRIQLLGRGMISAVAAAAAAAAVTATAAETDQLASTAASSSSRKDGDIFWQQQARLFEQQVLGLLHFCDPEASDYAWFTWHGTQCLVFAARLFALRPVLAMQRTQPAQPCSDKTAEEAATTPSQEMVSQSLRLVVQALEKVLVVLTDPRGEGFRWYITIQWHMLAIAVSDCYLCTDADLLRRAWPVVEELYRRYEVQAVHNDNSSRNGGQVKEPLSTLMRRTRDKMALLLRSGEDDDGNVGDGLGLPSSTTARLDRDRLHSTDADTLFVQDLLDNTGQPWEDLMSGVSFDELGSPGMYFLQ